MSLNQVFRSKSWGLSLLLLFIPFQLSAMGYKDINQAPSGDYLLDKTHGYVTFSYLHSGYSRPWLRFRDIDATLTLGEKPTEQASVSVTIDAASIDSGVDVFDEHLRGEDYFHVEKFPVITFRSTNVAFDGQQFLLTGELTMKGVSKNVTLEGVFNLGGQHFRSKKPMLGFSAKGQIKRSEWGLGKYAPFVGDDVDLVIEVEFIQP